MTQTQVTSHPLDDEDMFLLDSSLFEQSIPVTSVLPGCSIHIRHARRKEYLPITRNMELNSLPYKYHIRVEHALQCSGTFRLELCVSSTNQGLYQETPIQNGIVQEKLICRTESVMEWRVHFTVQSYSFGNARFFINVWCDNWLVHTSEEFELVARRNRKRTNKKPTPL